MKKILLCLIIPIYILLNLLAQEATEEILKDYEFSPTILLQNKSQKISFSGLKENRRFISLKDGYEKFYTVDKEIFNQNDIEKIEIKKYLPLSPYEAYIYGDTYYSITFYINEIKGKELSEYTKNNVGKRLLITINDEVISFGVILEEISSKINMKGLMTDGILYKLLANFDCINNISAKLPEKIISIPVEEYVLNPYEVNTKNAFEVVNAFFYFFLKEDPNYKKFISPDSKQDFEELKVTYKEKKPCIYLQSTPVDCDCLYAQLYVYENGTNNYYDSCIILQRNNDEIYSIISIPE